MYKSFPRPVSSGSIRHFWDEQPSISGDGQNSDGFGRIINSLSSLSACFEGCPMNIFIIVYMYINPPWFTKKHPKHTKIGRFGKSGKLKCQCQMVGMGYVIVPREGIKKKRKRDGSELTFQPNESFPRVQPVNPPNLLSAPRFAGGPWQLFNESLRTVVQYVIQANFATKIEHDSNKMSRMIQTKIVKKISFKQKLKKKYSNKTCKNASNQIGGWAVWKK